MVAAADRGSAGQRRCASDPAATRSSSPRRARLWCDVASDAFAAFAEPGHGRIACNFSVRPYGAGRTVLTYDCRVAGTDPRSRAAIARYWLFIRPFVGHIMRAALAVIAADAARRPAGTAAPAVTAGERQPAPAAHRDGA